MKLWKARLMTFLTLMALLLATFPGTALADHDDECDDVEWDGDEWVCVDDDDEDFDGIEVAEFDVEFEVVCFIDADWDGRFDEDWVDGIDNDGDWEIDEDDIDCFVEED